MPSSESVRLHFGDQLPSTSIAQRSSSEIPTVVNTPLQSLSRPNNYALSRLSPEQQASLVDAIVDLSPAQIRFLGPVLSRLGPQNPTLEAIALSHVNGASPVTPMEKMAPHIALKIVYDNRLSTGTATIGDKVGRTSEQYQIWKLKEPTRRETMPRIALTTALSAIPTEIAVSHARAGFNALGASGNSIKQAGSDVLQVQKLLPETPHIDTSIFKDVITGQTLPPFFSFHSEILLRLWEELIQPFVTYTQKAGGYFSSVSDQVGQVGNHINEAGTSFMQAAAWSVLTLGTLLYLRPWKTALPGKTHSTNEELVPTGMLGVTDMAMEGAKNLFPAKPPTVEETMGFLPTSQPKV